MEDNSSSIPCSCSLVIKIIRITSSSDVYQGKQINDPLTLILSSSLDNGQPLKRDVSFMRTSTNAISINASEALITFPKVSNPSSSSFTITIFYSDEVSPKVKLNAMGTDKEHTHHITIKDLCIEFESKFIIADSKTQSQPQSFPIEKLIMPQMIQLRKNILEEVIANNYYECFFISGLSRNNPQTSIGNSTNFKSQCFHKECSYHPAYNPSIVYSFIKKSNISIDINDYTSKLCFPKGIKVCYKPKDTSLNKKTIIHNVITGGNGNYYYLTALMFYIEFPIDAFPHYFSEIKLSNSKDNSVLIPFCFCLISAFYDPISTEDILSALLYDYQNDTTFDLDLIHLIYEIPTLPSIKSRITVYLPMKRVKLGSINPIGLNDMFIEEIIRGFNTEGLAIIIASLLMEHKVISVSSDHYILYNISLGLKAMIYPFKWRGTFIPNITEDSVKYVQSFIPFIMGIDRDIFDSALQLKLFNNEDDILIIDIDNKSLFKLMPNSVMIQYNKETIDSDISLNPISDYLRLKLVNKNEMSKDDVKDCLLKAISKLLINYQSYISFVGDNVLFNQTCFVSAINNNSNEDHSDFYSEFTSTQQFTEFVQECEKDEFKYFNSLCVSEEKNGHSIDTLSNIDDDFKVFIQDSINTKESDFSLLPYFFKANKPQSKNNIELDISNYYSTIARDDDDQVKYLLYEDAFIRFDLIMKNTHPKELRLYSLIDKDYYHCKSIITDSDCDSLSTSKALIETVENDNENDIDSDRVRDSDRDSDKRRVSKALSYSNKSRNSNKSRSSVPYRKTMSIVNMVLKSSTFKELEIYQDQIIELLRDYMGYVLINKHLPLLNSMSDFSLCFSKSLIRKEFAFIIFQEKFRQGFEHELIKSIYDHFNQMVFYVLLNTKDAKIEYENVRLITKSLFFYFTWKEANEKEYLFAPVVEHRIVFPFWTNKLFWEYYFKEELIQSPLENGNAQNDIVKTMTRLNIDRKFIEYCKTKVFK